MVDSWDTPASFEDFILNLLEKNVNKFFEYSNQLKNQFNFCLANDCYETTKKSRPEGRLLS